MRALLLMLALAGTAYASPRNTAQPTAPSRGKLEKVIAPWLGTPYEFGEHAKRRGTDCSGFVRGVAKEAFRMELPHSSREQFRMGRPVKRAQLRAGDLVFFAMDGGKRVSHVGIYMGGGRFAHASKSRGVVYDELGDYRKEYRGARRVLKPPRR